MGRKSKAKKMDQTGRLLPSMKSKLESLVDEVMKDCMKTTSDTVSAVDWDQYVAIYNKIEEIRKIESALDASSLNREEQIEPFLNWIKSHGVEMAGVEICDYGVQGFGMKVCTDLSKGQTVLSIPTSIMITEEVVKKSFLGTVIQSDPILSSMGNVALALFVLAEKVSPSSPWQPYLRLLPSDYETVLYYTPEQLQELKGSPLLEKAIKQYRNIARQYAYFYRLLLTHPDAKNWQLQNRFTFDGYRWAVSTVMTRQNRIPLSNGKGDQLALIPLWDLSNHEEGELSTDFDVTANRCVCQAFRNFSIGEQFTIYYGRHPNSELFLNNAFVCEGNPNDTLTIRIGMSQGDLYRGIREDILNLLGVPTDGYFTLNFGIRPISSALFDYVRVFCMDYAALMNCAEVDMLQQFDRNCDLGNDLKVKAVNFLLVRMGILKKGYPTTLENDMSQVPLLKGPNKLIRQLLISEKRILNRATAYLLCALHDSQIKL